MSADKSSAIKFEYILLSHLRIFDIPSIDCASLITLSIAEPAINNVISPDNFDAAVIVL